MQKQLFIDKIDEVTEENTQSEIRNLKEPFSPEMTNDLRLEKTRLMIDATLKSVFSKKTMRDRERHENGFDAFSNGTKVSNFVDLNNSANMDLLEVASEIIYQVIKPKITNKSILPHQSS